MNPYLTDEVVVVAVAASQDGAESTVAAPPVAARVSERPKMVTDSRGREVLGRMHAIMAAGAQVREGDRLKVRKLCGAAYAMPDKEWPVVRVSRAHGFGADHVEVWVGDVGAQ